MKKFKFVQLMQVKVRTDPFKLLRQAMLERWIMASVAKDMGFTPYWWDGVAKARRCRHYQVALGSGFLPPNKSPVVSKGQARGHS